MVHNHGRSTEGVLRAQYTTPVSRTALTVAFSLAVGALPVAAQISPQGPQFQVNDYATSTQGFSAVAVDAASSFVVVWESYGSNGNDDESTSIQAQRFDRLGSAVGAQFQVNTYTSGAQWYPSVAAEPGGGFVVAWMSFGSAGTDSDSSSVQARRYAASGDPLADQFQVNTYTTSGQGVPSVAVDDTGGFVITWESDGSPGSDASGASVQARRYDPAGAPLGDQFQVNTYTTSSQWRPRVASAPGGGFTIAWQSLGSTGPDSDYWSIQARRFDELGNPLGDQLQVNASALGDQERPAIADRGLDGFLVAWQSDSSAGTDTDGTSIQAQRFDGAGATVGPELQVNSYTTGDQTWPAVASQALGGFLVTWHSTGSGGSDTSGRSIQARQFRPTGTPLTPDFQVNTYTTDIQAEPAVAADDDGNVVVTWTSTGSPGPDQDGPSIQARRFDALFRDGFESGGTGRWSSTLP